MSGLYNQDGRKVIWNNSASIEKRHLGLFGNRKSKKTQFETTRLLFHYKGLLPPPAQFSPLLSVSRPQSGEVNTIFMIPNGSTCPMAPSDLKVWSWAARIPHHPPGAILTLPGCRNPSIAHWEALNLQPGFTVPSLPAVQTAPRFLICSWSYHVRLERL